MSKLQKMPNIRSASSNEQLAAQEQASKAIHERRPYLTVQERAERGKAARNQCPRSDLAAWVPSPDRPAPIGLLEAQAATRIPELAPIRYGRMLASPFAFYRGAAAIMASDLSTRPTTGLLVQLCGDAHLSNFGGFGSPERELNFDINDFDETLPGPWEWDVKRLAASIEIAGRERGFDAKELRGLVLGSLGEYRMAMQEFAGMGNLEMWYLHLSPAAVQARWGMAVNPKAIRALAADFAQAYSRDNVRAFEKLTRRVDGRRRIAAHPPLVVPIEDLLSDTELARFEQRMHNLLQGYRSTLSDDRRHLLDTYRYVATARKVVGVGSVGTRAWIVLLEGRDDSDPLFLQVKEAQASVLEPFLGKSVFGDHGKRVVEGQRLMQSASDIFLGWEHVALGIDGASHDYYVRQLWDWKVSADVATMKLAELIVYGKMCAWTLARAHGRTGDPIAINAYLGKSDVAIRALAEFAGAYADQNKRDYQTLVDAVNSGHVKAETGI